MDSSKVKFKNVIRAWWKFFWRYAILLGILLIANGFLINQLNKHSVSPAILYGLATMGSLLINLFAAYIVFSIILGKSSQKSDFIIIPSSHRKDKLENREIKINSWRTVLTSWNYFWRFMLFAFAIGFTLAKFFLSIGESLGYDPLMLSKYASYLGNLAVLPASLAVFILLMWRSEKRRKLEFIPVAE